MVHPRNKTLCGDARERMGRQQHGGLSHTQPSERSQTQRLQSVTPFTGHSRKGKTLASENLPVVARAWGWDGGNFWSDGNTLLVWVVVTRLYTFVKIQS